LYQLNVCINLILSIVNVIITDIKITFVWWWTLKLTFLYLLFMIEDFCLIHIKHYALMKIPSIVETFSVYIFHITYRCCFVKTQGEGFVQYWCILIHFIILRLI
jgi:hypothetical protein